MIKHTQQLIVIIIFFLLPISRSHAQVYNSAVEYLSSINEAYAHISKDTWDYAKVVAHSKRAKKIENRRKELIQTTLEAKRQIARMPSYEGNTALRDSLASYFNLSYLILKEDYAKIVDMEAIAEQSYDLMESYIMAKREVDNKREMAYNMVDNEFETFAKQFNINLVEGEESKLGRKLRKAGEVYDYYNPIYLIFFKSHIQESFLIESLNNRDMVAYEQNRNALEQYATEGLEEIRKTQPFLADNTLKRSCQQMLIFYQDEAKNKASKFTDFYLKLDNLEKLQKAIESKPKSKLTEKEIDSYNAAIKDYNNSLETYNRINDEVNNQRSKLIDSWNKTSSKFIDKHVP